MDWIERHRAILTYSLFTLSAFLVAPLGGTVKQFLLLLCAGVATIVLVVHGLRHRLHCRSPFVLFPPLLAVCLSLSVSLLFHQVYLARIHKLADRTVTAEATVKDISLQADYMTVTTVTVTRVDDQAIRASAILEIPFEMPLEIGDRLTFEAQAALFPEVENGFPTRSYYTSQGIFLSLTLDPEATLIREEGGDRFTAFFARLSSDLAARLTLALGEENGGFLSGLLTGRRDNVPEDLRRDCRFLGISHLLAISGLHLSVLVGGALYLFRYTRINRWVALPLLTVLILFACCLTGFPPSIVRAGCMLFLLLLGDAFGTPADPPTSLAFSCACILLFSPASLYDPGFLLSAAATAGIVFISAPFTRKLYRKTAKKRQLWVKPTRWLLAAFSVSLSAIVFTLPITYWYFGELALIAPLSNLFLIPLTGLILYLGTLLLLCYAFPIVSLLSAVTADVTALTIQGIRRAAALAPEPLSLAGNAAPLAFFLTAAVLIFLLLMKKKKAIVFLLSLTVWLLSFTGAYAVENALMTRDDTLLAVNDGRNDFILLNSNGRTLLIDISDGSYSGANRAASLCREALGDPSLDAVLYTHLHRKHTATFSRLSDTHRISFLCLPRPQDAIGTEVVTALTAIAEEKGIDVVLYDTTSESTVAFDRCRIVLSPTGFLDRSVQPLVSFSILGSHRFLYLGGGVTESDRAERILAEAVTADAVLFGIHGPLIKEPLASLPFEGTVLASDPEVNEAYGTSFDTVSNGVTITKKLVFRNT